MDSNSDMNARIPFLDRASSTADATKLSVAPLSSPSASALAFASLCTRVDSCCEALSDMESTIDLAAVTNTTMATSTAASSSLRSPSSRPASTSSLAITKEMETERSEEIADIDAVAISSVLKNAHRAMEAANGEARPVAAVTATPILELATPKEVVSYSSLYGSFNQISLNILSRAARTACSVKLPLCPSPLFMLSIFLSASSAPNAASKRTASGAPRMDRVHTVAGFCFGCCLGSVVQAVRGSVGKATASSVVQMLQTTLISCTIALNCCSGRDVQMLRAGMAAGHMCRGQLLQISNHDIVAKLHTRHGNSATALGVLVTIISVATCLATLHPAHSETIESGILSAIEDADRHLSRCIVECGGAPMSASEVLAHQVEQRALQRARCGIAVAQRIAAQENIASKQRMFLIIGWMSKAAYPPGLELDEGSHASVLKTVSKASFFMTPVLASIALDAKTAAGPAAGTAASLPSYPNSPPRHHTSHSNQAETNIVPLAEIKHCLCSARAFGAEDDTSSMSTLSSSLSSRSPSVISDGEGARIAPFSQAGLESNLRVAGLSFEFTRILFR